MALTARQVETTMPKEKDYKLSDERGLFLLVTPTGKSYWRMKYRTDGKEKKLSIGVYPEISLADARVKRDEARKVIMDGGDSSEKKQLEKLAKKISVVNTFRALAMEWHKHKSYGRKATQKAFWRLWRRISSRIWASALSRRFFLWRCWRFYV